MSFTKIYADTLFDGYRFRDENVLIVNEAGVVQELISKEDAGEDIRYVKGILSPGFINCHCHLELSHMKGLIEEHAGLVAFVGQVVQKRHIPEEDILQAIADAEDDMLRNGIVAVGDICNTTHALAQKSKGKLYYHHFIEVMGFDPAVAERNFSIFEKVYHTYEAVFPRKQISLTPHAPYSLSAALWEKVIHYPNNNLLSIHNQETQDENDWFLYKTGGFSDMYQRLQLDTSSFTASQTTSLQTYLQKVLPEQQVLLIHNVFTSQADIQYASKLPNKLFWCLCPNANQYISNAMPDVELFMKENCDIVLGTDSLASNHQLNIWEEIKTIQKFYPSISLETMLQWATSNGAKALRADDTLGSFEKGKKPGLVLIQDNEAQALQLK